MLKMVHLLFKVSSILHLLGKNNIERCTCVHMYVYNYRICVYVYVYSMCIATWMKLSGCIFWPHVFRDFWHHWDLSSLLWSHFFLLGSKGPFLGVCKTLHSRSRHISPWLLKHTRSNNPKQSSQGSRKSGKMGVVFCCLSRIDTGGTRDTIADNMPTSASPGGNEGEETHRKPSPCC